MANDWQAIAQVLANAVAAIDGIISDIRDRKVAQSKMTYAADALTAIGAIVGSVQRGDVDKMDPAQAQQQIDKLVAALSDNDVDADRAVEQKFKGD